MPWKLLGTQAHPASVQPTELPAKTAAARFCKKCHSQCLVEDSFSKRFTVVVPPFQRLNTTLSRCLGSADCTMLQLDAPHAMLLSSTMQQSFWSRKLEALAIFSAVLRVDRSVPDFLVRSQQLIYFSLCVCVCHSFQRNDRAEVSFQLPTLQGLPRDMGQKFYGVQPAEVDISIATMSMKYMRPLWPEPRVVQNHKSISHFLVTVSI